MNSNTANILIYCFAKIWFVKIAKCIKYHDVQFNEAI